MDSINRKQLVLLGIALLFVLFLVEAAVAPPAHAVHSIGGVAVNAAAYAPREDPTEASSDAVIAWDAGPPTESLGDVKCHRFALGQPPCTPADISSHFPNLHQADHTLYYVWTGCVDWSGAGRVIPWAGSNIEYFPSSRTLVLHCFVGTGLIYFPEQLFGAPARRLGVLLAIPTSGIGAGRLDIREDDRLEHLVGDTSNEYLLATATIS